MSKPAMTKSLKLISNRASISWIMLIYFASGACSLIDEVIWVRLLKLTLGNTVYASSIVVSIFMGGLALGAFIMGTCSDQITRRLRLYALLEGLITISALSLPFGLKIADNFYVWFFRAFNPGHGLLLAVQVTISAAILLIPAMLMGSTLPLLGRFVTAMEEETGHLVGRLYALNTLGAAVGCFLAGFVLIRIIGVMGALYFAAGLNLVVAFGGWFLSRYSGVSQAPLSKPDLPETSRAAGEKRQNGRFSLLLAAFFFSGLISIGYELLWMRSIVHLLGGFTYVFSAVLTVYLLGNVIGAGIGSKLAQRLKSPATGFAVTLLLLGICGVGYLPVLVVWTTRMLPRLEPAVNSVCLSMGLSSYLIGPMVQSFSLFIVPAIIMGIGFPMALQAWTNHVHKVGRSTGTAYAANTIGAVMGGVVTGFVLIPFLGVQISILILGLISVWTAGIMWMVFGPQSGRIGRRALVGAAIFLTIFVIAVPANLFNMIIGITTGSQRRELVAVKEGVTTTVSLHRDTDTGELELLSSGQSIAGDNYVARGDQKILGHFGVLLNKDSQRVLSVGFGSGETTACLAKHRLEQIDCVEIAPEVVEVSLNYFTHINLGDSLYEKINMIFMDAKNYLHLTDSKYDVIVNDSIHPREFAENASLYAKEYFESAQSRLKENGILASWLPTYDLSASVFDSIIGTALKVFPHVTLWYLVPQPAPLVLLVGSQQPQYYSVKYIDDQIARKNVSSSLAEINVHNSIDVMSCYIADEDDLRRAVEGFSINSDYHPFVEFTTAERDKEAFIFRQFVKNLRSDTLYKHLDWSGCSQAEKNNWLAEYKKISESRGSLFKALAAENNLDKLRYTTEGLAVLPGNAALLFTREKAEKILFADSIEKILSGRSEHAEQLVAEMLKIHPGSAIAWMIRSSALQNKGDWAGATACARRAIDLAPASSEARIGMGFLLLQAGQFNEAINEFKNAQLLAERSGKLTKYKKAQLLDSLAVAYGSAGRITEAVEAGEKAFELALSIEQWKLAGLIKKHLDAFKAQQEVPKGGF